MAKCEDVHSTPCLKRFKKIPIYVVEEHNDALQFIYSAIGGKRLPVEGTTLLHLDAHPDMLIPRRLTGNEARSGRDLLPLLEIENWIVPAAAAGHLGRAVWVRPPWATQLMDGSRLVRTGDRPKDGLLRVDCPEPYFLSDALYSSKLANDRTFTLTVAELGNPDKLRNNEDQYVKNLVESLLLTAPYVLDIDLDFFSTDNPFASLYTKINLYDLLEPIYEFDLPNNTEPELLDQVVANRERQLDELEELFKFLELHDSLDGWNKGKTEIFHKVSDLSLLLKNTYGDSHSIDWWAVHAAGCTRDQGGLPRYRCNEKQLANMMDSLRLLLINLPPPVLVTLARSTEDGYCPLDQREGQASVRNTASAVGWSERGGVCLPLPYAITTHRHGTRFPWHLSIDGLKHEKLALRMSPEATQYVRTKYSPSACARTSSVRRRCTWSAPLPPQYCAAAQGPPYSRSLPR
ncbi:UPF0489 protein C5orf22 homolog [Eumeta japonica]|uniref:UPF0489 protein C5orf22 homolog n=1 Tax=Eumeta variegata TaxID=151549 RepID=A0A4C1VF40_EUMVA|nr:UPF0489 protein C5orf22 homolog [Eumeta japonica]